jgi:hypothetical protein
MKYLYATCVAASLCLSALAPAQSNLGKDVQESPSAKFTPHDFDQFWATIDTVSNEKVTGAVKKWENAENGNGGSIKLLRSFTSTDGRDCRRLKVENHAKKLKGVSNMTVCADPQGKWLVDADARPAPKP